MAAMTSETTGAPFVGKSSIVLTSSSIADTTADDPSSLLFSISLTIVATMASALAPEGVILTTTSKTSSFLSCVA